MSKLIINILIFISVHLGVFVYGYYKQKYDPELQVLNRIGESVLLSRAAGLVLALDMSILLFPVCRNIIRIIRTTFLNKIIPFDEHILFHKMTAYSLLIFTIIHVNCHYENFFRVPLILPFLKTGTYQLHYGSYAGITGHIALLLMFLMFTATVSKIRKLNYEIFWFVHHLYFPIYILIFLHSFGCFVKSSVDGHCKGYNSNYFTIPALILYLIERLIRYIRSKQYTILTKVIFHPGNTMELHFEKPSLLYKPGQYLFLNVPEISYFQWHPFTISSCREEGFISLHIRNSGNWTSILEQTLKNSQNSSAFPQILIDGPFGAPSQDIFNYKVAALISSGIGITPAASILKSVIYAHQRNAPIKLTKLFFIMINRDREDLSWFKSLLSKLEKLVPKEFLDIQIYLTGKLEIDDIHNIALNTFKHSDAITGLETNTNYGRPMWSKLFQNIKITQLQNEELSQIGVFYCGSQKLGEVISKQCKNNSGKLVQFVCHTETV